MVQCPHCSQWLHAHCLEKRAVQTAFEKHNDTQSPPPKKRGRPSKTAQSNVGTSTAASAFKAKIHSSDSGKTRLTITDKRKGKNKRQWDVDISCLMCGEIIEEAESSMGSDNALEQEEDDSRVPLAHDEADPAIDHVDTDDGAAVKEPKPELPAPVETKGETAS